MWETLAPIVRWPLYSAKRFFAVLVVALVAVFLVGEVNDDSALRAAAGSSVSPATGTEDAPPSPSATPTRTAVDQAVATDEVSVDPAADDPSAGRRRCCRSLRGCVGTARPRRGSVVGRRAPTGDGRAVVHRPEHDRPFPDARGDRPRGAASGGDERGGGGARRADDRRMGAGARRAGSRRRWVARLPGRACGLMRRGTVGSVHRLARPVGKDPCPWLARPPLAPARRGGPGGRGCGGVRCGHCGDSCVQQRPARCGVQRVHRARLLGQGSRVPAAARRPDARRSQPAEPSLASVRTMPLRSPTPERSSELDP